MAFDFSALIAGANRGLSSFDAGGRERRALDRTNREQDRKSAQDERESAALLRRRALEEQVLNENIRQAAVERGKARVRTQNQAAEIASLEAAYPDAAAKIGDLTGEPRLEALRDIKRQAEARALAEQGQGFELAQIRERAKAEAANRAPPKLIERALELIELGQADNLPDAMAQVRAAQPMEISQGPDPGGPVGPTRATQATVAQAPQATPEQNPAQGLQSMTDRWDELVLGGKSEDEATAQVIQEFGGQMGPGQLQALTAGAPVRNDQ